MKTLLVGYKAADLNKRLIAECGDVTCHVLDIYHRHAIEKVHHLKVVCSPHLPDEDWDVVRFLTGPKLMSGELALDMLQECKRVAKGKPVKVDFVGRERDRNSLVEKVFGKDARERSFAAKYSASVPGSAPIELVSLPGCFCHRRTDEGGLALAEVVSKQVSSFELPVSSEIADSKPVAQNSKLETRNLKLLDMGCGNGLVGFLIANALSNPSSHPHSSLSLVMVDSHSRAVEAANINSRNLGIPAEIILADNGTPQRMDGTFDVFVGNSPYYSEYRIAEVFYETAKRALKPGGHCFMVCKNAAGLRPVAEQYFMDIAIIPRRGYSILHSVNK